MKVNEFTIKTSSLPKNLNGLKLLHLSDFHFRRKVKMKNNLIHYLNKLDYDMVCLTGDYAEDLEGFLAFKEILKSINVKYGAFAVLGNHDYYYDLPRLKELFNDSKVKLLINEGEVIEINGEKVHIGGVDVSTHDDVLSHLWDRADLNKSVVGNPKNFRILLAHSPDIIEEAAKEKINLVLVGHTHGGQIRLPFIGALYASSKFGTKYASGLFKVNSTMMYVTRGIGSVKVNLGKKKVPFTNLRINCVPEIALITFRGV